MDVRITIETNFDNGEKRTHQLDGISRPCRVTCPDGIGLRLEDGQRIIEQIQRVVLYDQVEEIIRESHVCPADLFLRWPISFRIGLPRSCSGSMPSLCPGIPFAKPRG